METTSEFITVVDESSFKGDDSNWKTIVEFYVDDPKVRIYNQFGNGQSMNSFEGKSYILLTTSCNYGSMQEMVDTLESEHAQILMNNIISNYELIYTGSNYRGSLSEDGVSSLDELKELLENQLEYLPQCWAASDWFRETSAFDIVSEIKDFGGIRETAQQYVKDAAPEYFLDEEDVYEYINNLVNDLASDELVQSYDQNKIDIVNEARELEGLPTRWMTIRQCWEKYDQGRPEGVSFEEFDLEEKTVILVNDRNSMWLALPEDLEYSLDTYIKVNESEESASLEWYVQLCCLTEYQKGLIPAFETQYGERNFA